MLLAAILGVLLFGPTPALFLAGLFAALVVLIILAVGIGEIGGAFRRVSVAGRSKPPGVAPTLGAHAVADALTFAEWEAREPDAAAKAKAAQAAWVDSQSK